MKPDQPDKPAITEIITAVCQATGTTPAEIKSAKRTPRLVTARVLISRHARRHGYRLSLIAFCINKSVPAVTNHPNIYNRLSFRDHQFKSTSQLVASILYA